MYFDGHNDLLWRLAAAGGSVDEFLVGSCPGHLDLRRIQSAGLIGGLFAISIAPWIGSTSRCQREILPNGGYAWPYSPRLTLAVAQDAVVDQRETFRTLISRGEERIFAIRKKGDLSRLQPHALGVVLHLEGADPISDDLSNLDEWHELGLRSLGITWSRPNAFGHGVPIRFPSSADIGSGLTPAGRSLLKSCNERGILVDVSHLNEAGFWDVIRHTRGPVVASHSNYHTLCPSSRNLTDDQARAIKDTGGVIGLNFGCHDLRPDGNEDANTPLELLAQHCLYGLELLGEEFVALGSDFDGTTVPIEIGDVTGLSKLRSVLRSKQVNESTLNKICRDNWLRVLGATLPHA